MATGRAPALALASVLTVAAAFGQGWVGQKRVNPPNGAVPDGAPSIAVDLDGRPWVAWDTKDSERLGDTTMVFSVWQGAGWDGVRGVGPNKPGVLRRLNSSIAFDACGRAWLAWHNANADNSRDIGASFWADTAWGGETQVNQPDSTEMDFRPTVSCGGGQVWCVWYGGLTDTSHYSVYAARWSSDSGRWEGEMRVSPADGNHHWWCDVVVDSLGTPHAVWCTSPLGAVFYSYLDNGVWVRPVAVNDTSVIQASPRGAPHIAIDRDGVIHLSFTGNKVGALHRDIFYSRNRGSGWSSCQMVTRDSLYDEWYSDIAAESRNSVWIAWDRQNEGADQFRVYAAHFDGRLWSSEQRLDDDSAYYDGSPSICLDHLGEPWVVWNAISNESGQGDVFYNRVEGSGCADEELGLTSRSQVLYVPTHPKSGPVGMSFEVERPSAVIVAVFDMLGRHLETLFDGLARAGRHELLWNGEVAFGVYFCRFTSGKFDVTRKMILTGL